MRRRDEERTYFRLVELRRYRILSQTFGRNGVGGEKRIEESLRMVGQIEEIGLRRGEKIGFESIFDGLK